MISVTVATDDTWITCETDAAYSPDLLDDISTHAATTLLATLRALAETATAD